MSLCLPVQLCLSEAVFSLGDIFPKQPLASFCQQGLISMCCGPTFSHTLINLIKKNNNPLKNQIQSSKFWFCFALFCLNNWAQAKVSTLVFSTVSVVGHDEVCSFVKLAGVWERTLKQLTGEMTFGPANGWGNSWSKCWISEFSRFGSTPVWSLGALTTDLGRCGSGRSKSLLNVGGEMPTLKVSVSGSHQAAFLLV